jgi:hypothetical protein
VAVPGIESFLHHESFIESVRTIFDFPYIVPTHVYANVMLPGQELPVHTDIPEFLGADRTQLPMWLLVVMHHSGLFEDRRIATASAIAYVEGGAGGEFATTALMESPTWLRRLQADKSFWTRTVSFMPFSLSVWRPTYLPTAGPSCASTDRATDSGASPVLMPMDRRP